MIQTGDFACMKMRLQVQVSRRRRQTRQLCQFIIFVFLTEEKANATDKQLYLPGGTAEVNLMSIYDPIYDKCKLIDSTDMDSTAKCQCVTKSVLNFDVAVAAGVSSNFIKIKGLKTLKTQKNELYEFRLWELSKQFSTLLGPTSHFASNHQPMLVWENSFLVFKSRNTSFYFY